MFNDPLFCTAKMYKRASSIKKLESVPWDITNCMRKDIPNNNLINLKNQNFIYNYL